MSTLKVEVEQDHLERLIKTPLVGIAELIWNALDADATTVTCTIEENDAGGAETLVVADDGSGINPERAALAFGHLGGSWKKTTATTDDGRALHGRLGQGRWAAYGLGEIVKWDTVAEHLTQRRTRIAIAGRSNALREFVVSDPQVVDEPTGTTVRVENLSERAVKALAHTTLTADLTALFALYLQQYPVTIDWLGTVLDPKTLQARKEAVDLIVEGVAGTITITIIEWNTKVDRALHLCDGNGVALTQVQPGIQAPGFEFTAYLAWDGFRERMSEVLLGEMAEEPIPAVLEAAKQAMRAHFKERVSQRGRELIDTWVKEESWPYKQEPQDSVEKAERDLFEVVAVAAAPVVETSDKKSRSLTLRLLREAVETSPGTLHEVLQEVLNLPQDRVDELRDLLQRTTLSAVIASARAITNRLDFLSGLETLVFDTETKKYVKERSQLHRILANETWVFREEYLLTADDQALHTALKAHIGLLGREDLTPADASQEVLDHDGKRMVVDLMLSRVIEQSENQRHHIVIELKRPSVHIGLTEFSQIQKYASALAKDPRFDQASTFWEFWIVGDEIEDPVTDIANQNNRESGVLVDTPSYVVRGVTWAKVIQDARHRLNFVRKSLEYVSTTDQGREYLERVHGEYLPPPRMSAE